MENAKRIFAIGDIHGCFDELRDLVEKLPLDENSVLVFLGDYIDRGPNTRGVIDYILQLKSRVEVVTLKGNHEAMLLDFLEHPESAGAALFILNGGSSTLASYSKSEGHFEIPREHVKFFADCLPYYQTEEFFFVHAGLRNRPLAKIHLENEDTLFWIRDSFLNSTYDWGKVVVHGHTPVSEVTIKTNRINLDTGCVFGGRLSAMELPQRQVFQEPRDIPAVSVFLKDARPQRVAYRFNGAVEVFVVKKGQVYGFETLNYNEFGLLIREVQPSIDPLLKVGEMIQGVIGQDPVKQVAFEGEVVRMENNNSEAPLYGVKVKIDRKK